MLETTKSPRVDVPGAFIRESLCYDNIGGGGGTRTPVQRSVNKSVYERILHFESRASDSCRRDSSAPVRRWSSTVDGLKLSSKPVKMTPGSVHTGRERADAPLIKQRERNYYCSRLLFCRFLRGQRRLGSQLKPTSPLSTPIAPTERARLKHSLTGILYRIPRP
jgi:hypothetical protein